MRILLTGAKGQLGQSIKAHLPENWELIATDSKTLNITDYHTVLNMMQSFQPDAIINAAGYTSTIQSDEHRQKAFAVNADGTRNLAQAAKAVGAKFIHISTDYVFNGHSRIPYTETDAPNPQGIYGQSKLAGELLALTTGANALIIRTAWIFSEYGNNTVKTLLRQAAEGKEIRLVDNQAGCPTYAGDLADAIIKLLQLTDFPNGILHYCGNHALSAYKFAQAVFKAESERNPNFIMPTLTAIDMAELNPHFRRPQYSALNGDKARGLGLTPSDWQKALPYVLAAIAQD